MEPLSRYLCLIVTVSVTGKVWVLAASCIESDSNDNCREGLLKSLSKYIKIDVYGKCGNLTCSRGEEGECEAMLNDSYKFYLAFENSVCEVMMMTIRVFLWELVMSWSIFD